MANSKEMKEAIDRALDEMMKRTPEEWEKAMEEAKSGFWYRAIRYGMDPDACTCHSTGNCEIHLDEEEHNQQVEGRVESAEVQAPRPAQTDKGDTGQDEIQPEAEG